MGTTLLTLLEVWFMLKVSVSLDELCDAYEMNSDEISHYLDVNTGEILMRMDPLLTGYKDGDLEEELEDEERYLELPTIASRDAYGLMVDFVEIVTSTELQDRLNTALNGRKPFRTFKDVLFDFPEEREKWFKFERETHRREILQWLEDENITIEQNKI
ncbi:hypothetical protein AN477_15080 [Alicyclobacillus ferrooxydans]|uniref:Uncharacterized protein n=2 Tax=Alicyclobacillus ferrooxydans TaxID=471514 RepID=A0A0P9EVB1_9BACL|nr:hypothetical protein AN477_15080 [Alicyclobacillus ferrooxydans]